MLTQIKSSINSLVKNDGDGWFLIIEEPESMKFVQFAWGETEGIIFNLPSQTLSTEELELASKKLKYYGIEYEAWPSSDAAGEVIIDEQGGFNKNLGNDAALAQKLASLILYEVYGLDRSVEFSVTIDK